ncbi:MAG TPA: endolytic transglycosylase MltG [Candidatus Paceibacterota bacterium]|nr:endolytic transglycosylase MltG [Candidatus Paceibacterota bacterium]
MPSTPFRRFLVIALLAGLVLFALGALCISLLLWRAPSSFPEGEIVTVPEGTSVRGAALLFEQKDAVYSAEILTLLIRAAGDGIRAGAYLLEEPQGALPLALRLVHGDFWLAPVKLTFPEGITLRDMARICARDLLGCSAEEFLEAAEGKEGYLFPETYFFLPGTSATRVVEALRAEFGKRTFALRAQAGNAGRSFEDVVVMASLLEGEASSTKHREAVAGILWKRLSIDMPLQVDAAFAYVNGKTTFDLTKEDLAIDSPYNTYINKGLPPTAISNPGLDALSAAIKATSSPYLYYLTGNDGVFYFARTYEEHLKNKEKYLRF